MKHPSSIPRFNLTSYALGEIAEEETPLYEAVLKSDTSLRAEFDRIVQTVRVLEQYPPAPTRRLHPQQLQNVLKGPKNKTAASVQNKVIPFYKLPLIKYAAAAVCTIGAFILGHITSSQLQNKKPALSQVKESKLPPLESSSEENLFPPVVANTIHPLSDFQRLQVENLEPKDSPQLRKYLEVKEKMAQAYKLVPVETPTLNKPQVKSKPGTQLLDIIATIPSSSAPIRMSGFTDTLKTSESTFAIIPSSLRDQRDKKPDAPQLASMLDPKIQANTSPIKKETIQPPLEIHSWKTELLSCPWDPTRRLLKVIFHLPINQTGIQFQDASYLFKMNFDSFQVLGFRTIADRHVASTSDSNLASRILWYEIIPSRNFDASIHKPIKIGELKILPPKGNTQNSVSSPVIPLVDVGTTWKAANSELVYETSMVAFGMLLQGVENTSFLDHAVVLEIAEAYKGNDQQGTKEHFIRLIRNSTQAGGLNN